MAVIHVEKTQNYTVMSNYHLRDKSLSLKAVGLLSKILSLPPNWDYTVEGLESICRDGRDGIRAALKELEERGYLTRTRVRDRYGKLGGMEYTIRECPNSAEPVTENPTQEKPTLEKPTQAKPTLENPTQLNTNRINTDKVNTKGINTESGTRSQTRRKSTDLFTPPTCEEVRAYCTERGNSIDPESFVDYYAARNWNLSNSQKMVDWKAAVRNWEHRERRDGLCGSSFETDSFFDAAAANTYKSIL